MTVLERILQLRNERDWTEYRLSVESGIAQTTISSWFRKNINPSITSLERICEAFHMPLSQFFAFDNESVTLTDEQKQLLNHWNRLNEKQREIILELLQNM